MNGHILIVTELGKPFFFCFLPNVWNAVIGESVFKILIFSFFLNEFFTVEIIILSYYIYRV